MSLYIALAICAALSLAFCLMLYRSLRIEAIERRVMQFANTEGIQELESSFLGLRVRAVKSQQPSRPATPIPTRNVPPPAVRAAAVTISDTIVTTDDEIIYYSPENPDPENPVGTIIQRYVCYIHGKGKDATHAKRELVPVIAPCNGIWYPPLVDPRTNVAYHPIKPPRHLRRKEYRNVFNGEFVVKGDLLGMLIAAKKPRLETEVRAPVTGNIVHFGAYANTPLAKHALVYLIAATGEVIKMTSQHIGTYTLASPGQPPVTILLGKPVPKGAILGYAHSLKIHIPIIAPEGCTLVRTFVEEGKPIDHGALLFEYLPTS